MVQYSFSKNIEGNEPLTHLFNAVLKEMSFLRMISAPSSTYSFEHSSDSMSKTFFDCCIAEVYFNRVIDELRKWKTDTIKYVNEFQCSWKYYSLSRKNDLSNEYGHDDTDYDDNGDLRTSFTDDELSPYTLPGTWLGYNDIFLTAEPSDFAFISRILENVGIFSFLKFKEAMGWGEIKTYTQEEDGSMKQMSWEDEVLQDAEKQIHADSLSEIMKWVLYSVRILVNEVSNLNPTEDNKEYFESLVSRIDNILNLKIS